MTGELGANYFEIDETLAVRFFKHLQKRARMTLFHFYCIPTFLKKLV